MKRWWMVTGILLLSVAAWGAEGRFLAVGGAKEKSRAELLKQRVEREMQGRIPVGARVYLHRAEGVWLVEIGPLGGDAFGRAALMERLAAAGFDPFLLETAPQMKPAADSGVKSREWAWGALLLLGLLGAGYFVRRFRQTRKLSGSQEALEESQLRLEREMKEGERHHEA